MAVAAHALALVMIAEQETADRNITSAEMARNVGVHPVHVRRVLARLREAGLVTSQSGPGGGWLLARPSTSITLADVYHAVSDDTGAVVNESEPQACCRFAPNMTASLDAVLVRAEAALVAELATVTLADLVESAQGERTPRPTDLVTSRNGHSPAV